MKNFKRFRTLINEKTSKINDITDNVLLSDFKEAYYGIADNIYQMEEIIDNLEGFEDMKKSFEELLKKFQSFDKRFELGKNL